MAFDTFPDRSGRVGLDDVNSDNRANSVQLELELGLSLAKINYKYSCPTFLEYDLCCHIKFFHQIWNLEELPHNWCFF